MKRRLRYYRMFWLRHDLPAGLSVFLVALPLCLGIALASGAPLYAGIISGIVGGMVVSLISGSAFSVSGPAAGLTTIVAASIVSAGSYQVFLLSIIIAGALQIVLGTLKLGTIANYFPSSVIKGLLAAIGLMLVLKQIPILLGYDRPDFWQESLSHILSDESFREKFLSLNHQTGMGAIAIASTCLLVAILLKQPFAKKLNILPVPLIIVLTGVIVNLIFIQVASVYTLKETQLVNIPANIFADISLPDFSKIFSKFSIWKDGILICVLASLETLLCVEAIDKLDRQNRITPVNKELVAQGIGNITCGILGGIPITAVVVRGSANVDAGARTRLSAFTHGVFLLLAVLLIPFLLNKIPYAALAVVLLITGYNLTTPKLYKNMWSLGLKQFVPFITTIIVILSTDLLIGVSVGLLISIYYIIRDNFKPQYYIRKEMDGDIASYKIRLNSSVTFLNKVNLKKTLDKIPNNCKLTIDGSNSGFIDYDILETISEYENKAKNRHITLTLVGIDRVDVTAIH